MTFKFIQKYLGAEQFFFAILLHKSKNSVHGPCLYDDVEMKILLCKGGIEIIFTLYVDTHSCVKNLTLFYIPYEKGPF